jgi:hypothetical protein
MSVVIYRVTINGNRCWVYGNKKGDIVTYDQRYSFRIWPWTNMIRRIRAIKRRMLWECALVMQESTRP